MIMYIYICIYIYIFIEGYTRREGGGVPGSHKVRLAHGGITAPQVLKSWTTHMHAHNHVLNDKYVFFNTSMYLFPL